MGCCQFYHNMLTLYTVTWIVAWYYQQMVYMFYTAPEALRIPDKVY